MAPDPWPHDEFIHGYWVAPASILAGEYPGALTEDKARSKINLLVDHGIRSFVDLTAPEDRMKPYEHLLVEASEWQGLDLQRITHPIPDMGTVAVDEYVEIVHTVRAATARGGVYVHCWGGIGRTGTVVGCLLVDDGLSADAALARIEELRRPTRKEWTHAPQTKAQTDIIHQYEEHTRTR